MVNFADGGSWSRRSKVKSEPWDRESQPSRRRPQWDAAGQPIRPSFHNHRPEPAAGATVEQRLDAWHNQYHPDRNAITCGGKIEVTTTTGRDGTEWVAGHAARRTMQLAPERVGSAPKPSTGLAWKKKVQGHQDEWRQREFQAISGVQDPRHVDGLDGQIIQTSGQPERYLDGWRHGTAPAHVEAAGGPYWRGSNTTPVASLAAAVPGVGLLTHGVGPRETTSATSDWRSSSRAQLTPQKAMSSTRKL